MGYIGDRPGAAELGAIDLALAEIALEHPAVFVEADPATGQESMQSLQPMQLSLR